MNATSTLEPAIGSRPSPNRRPDDITSFSTLVAQHTMELPGTDWLSRLQLNTTRENVRCLSPSLRFWKRAFDIIAALFLLIAALPLTITAAIAVKLTSPGRIIYSQTRIGLNLRKKKKNDRRTDALKKSSNTDRRQPGRDRRELSNFGQPFTIYKFRTMRNDAEQNGAQFALEGDPRVTSVGWLLRRTRIDELPQLWNILKGEYVTYRPTARASGIHDEAAGTDPEFYRPPRPETRNDRDRPGCERLR